MNTTRSFTEAELIDMIRDESRRPAALEHLYRESRIHIDKLVGKYWSRGEDARELAAEAILKLVEQVNAGKFQGQSSLKTYFLGICKYKLWEKLGKQGKYQDLVGQEETLQVAEDLAGDLDRDAEILRVRHCLEQLEARCRQLLRWRFWEPEDWPWQAVAEALGLANAQVARNQGQRCFHKFRELYEKPIKP